MLPIRSPFLLVLSVMLAGCAGPRAVTSVPDDALPIASIRPAPGPQPLLWKSASELPADAHRSDGSRALLLEVTLAPDASVASVETAPLELANLIVRVAGRDARSGSVSLESTLPSDIKLDLYVSPDGERYRYVSSCPIIAGGSAFEMFAEPVAWIAISGVRSAEGGQSRCE